MASDEPAEFAKFMAEEKLRIESWIVKQLGIPKDIVDNSDTNYSTARLDAIQWNNMIQRAL